MATHHKVKDQTESSIELHHRVVVKYVPEDLHSSFYFSLHCRVTSLGRGASFLSEDIQTFSPAPPPPPANRAISWSDFPTPEWWLYSFPYSEPVANEETTIGFWSPGLFQDLQRVPLLLAGHLTNVTRGWWLGARGLRACLCPMWSCVHSCKTTKGVQKGDWFCESSRL